jgi:hypothetical protein
MEFEERSAEGAVLEPWSVGCSRSWQFLKINGVFTRELSEDIPSPLVLWNQQVTAGARERSLITKTLKAKS